MSPPAWDMPNCAGGGAGGTQRRLIGACFPSPPQVFSDDLTKPIIDNIVSDLIQIYSMDTEIP